MPKKYSNKYISQISVFLENLLYNFEYLTSYLYNIFYFVEVRLVSIQKEQLYLYFYNNLAFLDCVN